MAGCSFQSKVAEGCAWGWCQRPPLLFTQTIQQTAGVWVAVSDLCSPARSVCQSRSFNCLLAHVGPYLECLQYHTNNELSFLVTLCPLCSVVTWPCFHWALACGIFLVPASGYNPWIVTYMVWRRVVLGLLQAFWCCESGVLGSPWGTLCLRPSSAAGLVPSRDVHVSTVRLPGAERSEKAKAIAENGFTTILSCKQR